MIGVPKAIRLNKKERAKLRLFVYDRDNGCCVRCERPVLRETGHWWSAHLMQSVGAGGDDTPANTETGCIECHIGIEHSYGKSGIKPVPAKVSA
jgi:hypothetical protein